MLRRRTHAFCEESAAPGHPSQVQPPEEHTRSSGQRVSMVQLREPPEKFRIVPVTAARVWPRLASGSKPETAPVWIWSMFAPLLTLKLPRAANAVNSLQSGSAEQIVEQLPSRSLAKSTWPSPLR